MTPQAQSTYPSRLSYVLKLRGDATSDAPAGRLENLVTGRRLEFASSSSRADAIANELDAGAGAGESSAD